MNGREEEEAMDEWQQIEFQSATPNPRPPSRDGESSIDGVISVRDDYIPVNPSSFPPSQHEGLDLSTPPLSPTSPPRSSTPSEYEQSIGPVAQSSPPDAGDPARLWASCVCFVGPRFWKKVVSAVGVMGAAAAAVLMYLKLRRRRQQRRRVAAVAENETSRRLVLIIKERDQMISQLLLKIARMNELMLASRKVAVVQVY